MAQTLDQIAQQLHAADKKVQLIYAFNGTGKTRLSRTMKNLIAPKPEDGEDGEPSREKILYYNAFTEDLFYWVKRVLGFLLGATANKKFEFPQKYRVALKEDAQND